MTDQRTSNGPAAAAAQVKDETQSSKPRRKRSRRVDSQSDSAGAPEIEFAPPLRPRRKLLLGLSILLALWVAFLLALYFQTVYPERRADDPRTAAPLTSESRP